MKEIDIGSRYYGADIKRRLYKFEEQLTEQDVTWINLDYDFAGEYDNYLTEGGEKLPYELLKGLPRYYAGKDFPKNCANSNIEFVKVNSRSKNAWKSSKTKTLDMHNLDPLQIIK